MDIEGKTVIESLFSSIGITCVTTESSKEDDEWLWDSPLAVIANAKFPANSLKAFTEEAVKPFGCDLDLEVDRNRDILKQMLRKYKNPSFDITKRLCVEFVDELGIDAGGVSREYFHLLMERLKQGPGGAINVFEGLPGHQYYQSTIMMFCQVVCSSWLAK